MIRCPSLTTSTHLLGCTTLSIGSTGARSIPSFASTATEKEPAFSGSLASRTCWAESPNPRTGSAFQLGTRLLVVTTYDDFKVLLVRPPDRHQIDTRSALASLLAMEDSADFRLWFWCE